MAGNIVRQFFGPSPRHERACVELSFAMDGNAYRLAPLEPVLARFGFTPGEYLPDEPVPLDEAVCRIAGAMLASAKLGLPAPWWSRHGSEGERGWAAISHPFPQAAAVALGAAHGFVRFGDKIPAGPTTSARAISGWLSGTMKTRVLVLAAAGLQGLETAHLNDVTKIYQVGQGARGVHFDQARNGRDAATGTTLDQNKHLTCLLLRRLGLPATRGVLVRSAKQATAAIARVGLPCVVKPVAMNQGRGVATMLRTEAQVLAAFAHVRTLSDQPVLIENHVEGDDHRLMVSGGELLWALRKDPAAVTGDGTATIGQLIERENARRAALRGGTEVYLNAIRADAELGRVLADRYEAGLETVLPKGTRIQVASQANVAQGGTLTDVTGEVHPDNREMAIRAAQLIRTRTMGIDFITPNISRSWKEVPCAIVEVNGAPAMSGLGSAAFLLRAQFPNRLSGRIPTVAAVGSEAFRAAATIAVEGAFEARGMRTVRADYSGQIAPSDPAILPSPQAPAVETLMLDPEADAALVLCDPGPVEQRGFPLRRCDLLIIEGQAPPAWLAGAAGTVLAGKGSKQNIVQAVGELARHYADPAEGGPLPVLEPVEAGDDVFRIKVWRARPMPRAWFWRQVGIEAATTEGLTTHDDLLAAVRALAGGVRGASAAEFAYPELIGPWFRVAFEATLPLPARGRMAARTALLAATERVNAIAAMTIEEDEAR